jgi:hypothetical protein
LEAKLNKINQESIFEKKKINKEENIKAWLKKLEYRVEDYSFYDYVLRKIQN